MSKDCYQKKPQNAGWTHMSNIYVHYLRNKKLEMNTYFFTKVLDKEFYKVRKSITCILKIKVLNRLYEKSQQIKNINDIIKAKPQF